MGIPKFYRWLTERYPLSLQPIGTRSPVVYDALYLDLNSVIHNCAHPFTETARNCLSMEEITAKTLRYMSLLMSVVQPRRLLYVAVDGVAPRAKMNQQRARRFRAAKTAAEDARVLARKGVAVPAGLLDTNAISPGTAFMQALMDALRVFVQHKQATDALWARVEVVFSGHDVPGEGEHKIMAYLRAARARPGHDARTRHCLYGPDADLILLGLVSYEPHVSILREETLTPCAFSADRRDVPAPLQLLHVSVLREYLEADFAPAFAAAGVPFAVDRLVDDLVFMMCLIGNDFLPNLPNVGIAEHSVELMFALYQQHIGDFGGFLTDGSALHLPRVARFLSLLAAQENGSAAETIDLAPLEKINEEGQKASAAFDSLSDGGDGDDKESDDDDKSVDKDSGDEDDDDKNETGGIKLKGLDDLVSDSEDEDESDEKKEKEGKEEEEEELTRTMETLSLEDTKKKKDEQGEQGKEAGEKPLDFWHQPKSGKRNESYVQKLGKAASLRDAAFVEEMARAYLDGVSWVLQYYHEGVASWDWFYPYHYAPFLTELSLVLPRWTAPVFPPSTPCAPLEQLLGVLPPQSSALVPATYRSLMHAPASPVLEYYPTTFRTDLNGKKNSWEELVLIPFIDGARLRAAMRAAEAVLPLTPEDLRRNALGVPLSYTVPSTATGATATGTATTGEELDSCLPTIMPGSFVSCSRVARLEADVGAPHARIATSGLPTHAASADPAWFPRLRCVPFATTERSVGVRVHSWGARGASAVCVLGATPGSSPAEALEAARPLLGATVLAGWPHFYPAHVVALCSAAGVVDAADPAGPRVAPFADGGAWFARELAALAREALRAHAVSLEHVTVLAEVMPLKGLLASPDGARLHAFDNSTALVPLQTLCLPPPGFLRQQSAPQAVPQMQAPQQQGRQKQVLQKGQGQGQSVNQQGTCCCCSSTCSTCYNSGSTCTNNSDDDYALSEKRASSRTSELFPEGTRVLVVGRETLLPGVVARTHDASGLVDVRPCAPYAAGVDARVREIVAASITARGTGRGGLPPPAAGRSWVPFTRVAEECGLAGAYAGLLAVLGAGEFAPRHRRAGLGLFVARAGPADGDDSGVPLVRDGWALLSLAEPHRSVYFRLLLADACIPLVTEYRQSFPEVFAALCSGGGGRGGGHGGGYGRGPDAAVLGHNANAILAAAMRWVAEGPHTAAPLVPAGSVVLPAPAVARCVEVAEDTPGATSLQQWRPLDETSGGGSSGGGGNTSEEDASGNAAMAGELRVPAAMLLRAQTLGVAPQMLAPLPVLGAAGLLRELRVGDRVVNLLADGLVDFGACGTVVAVKGVHCDVAFDRAQYGGCDLSQHCPDYHGATRHRSALVPFPVVPATPAAFAPSGPKGKGIYKNGGRNH